MPDTPNRHTNEPIDAERRGAHSRQPERAQQPAVPRRPEQGPSYRHARPEQGAAHRNARPKAMQQGTTGNDRALHPDSGQPKAPKDKPFRNSSGKRPQGLGVRQRIEEHRNSSRRPAEQRDQRGRRVRTHKPNFMARAINQWWDRLINLVMERSVDDQRDMYASHRTTRDYVWNSIGTGAWGMVFPVLTIVCTQIVGAEQAGMFSMAFVTGLLLMFLGNYGIRTFQLSDIEERHSFLDYQVNRVLTCIAMMFAGWLYCQLRGYDSYMFLICMGVYAYKMIDALADVYEGRLQQVDKLYLAGISQALRSIAALVVFTVFLFVSHNLAAASIAMAIAAVVSFVVLTLPLAYLETPKSKRLDMGSVVELFKQCFPLFIALFMYNLIDNMPKFVMEGTLSYDNQLYYSALYFPANALLLIVQVIYKPQLVRLANVWAQARRRRFDLIIVAMMAVILVLTVGLGALMATIGIPVLSFLYGVDFTDYRGLAVIMVLAGGVSAAIDFLYQIITVLRKQGSVLTLYLITFGFSLFIPILLIHFTQLPGAILSYLIILSILLVLLVWEYGRIRMQMSRERAEKEAAEAAEDPQTPLRPSEIRAERRRRAEVMERRTGTPRGKHSK